MADFLINVVVNTRGATRGVQQVDRSLSNIERSISRIGQLLTAVFAFQVFSNGIRAITDLSDSIVQVENRLRGLGVEGSRAVDVTARLFDVANETRTSFDSVGDTFGRLQLTLGSLGATEDEVINATRTLTQTIALSGATTTEAEGALRQFTQGLAANRLSGQELNSVLEQLPFLAQLIANELGVAVGELRTLANQGLITSDVLRNALANSAVFVAQRFAQTIPTVSQAFVVLRNNVIETVGGFLQSSGAANTLAQAIISLANNLDRALEAFVAFAAVLGAGLGIPVVTRFFALLARNPFVTFVTVLASATSALTAFADEIAVTEDGVVSLGDFASAAFDRFASAARAAFTVVGTAISETVNAFAGFDVSFQDVLSGVAQTADQLLAIFVFVRDGIDALLNDTLNTFRRFGEFLRDAIFGVDTPARAFVESIRTGLRALGTGLGEEAEENIGGLADQGTAEFIRRVALGQGPVTQALQNVLNDARVIAGQTAEQVGGVTAQSLVDGFNQTLREEAITAAREFNEALENISGRIADFAGLSNDEFENFAANISTLFGGVDFSAIFSNIASEIGAAFGVAGSEIVNALSGAIAIADELGFSLEDAIGERGVQAVRLLGVVTSDEFQAIISLLGGVINAVASTVAAWIGYGTTATAANTSIATSGAAATAATASTGVAATGASGAFATLGTVLSGVGTVIATVFNAILTGVVSIASTISSVLNIIASAIASVITILSQALAAAIVELLGALALGLTLVGEAALASVVGLAIAAVFLAIVAVAAIALAIAIDIITDAVIRFTEFLFETAEELETFVNNIGDAVDQLIRRIVGSIRLFIDEVIGLFGDFFDIPARLAGELVDAILDLFRELARGIEEIVQLAIDTVVNIFVSLVDGVLQIVGALVDGIIELFRRLGEGIAEIIQIAIDIIVSIFEGLGDVLGAIIDVIVGLFEGLGQAAVAVFEAIGAVGEAIAQTLTAVFQALGAAVTAIFQALGAAISAVFDAVGSAARALGAAMEAVFRALGAAVTAIFNALGAAISSIFNAIGAAARALGSAMESIFRALGAAIEAIFRSIGAAANITFTGIFRAASEIVSSIIGFFADLLVAVIRVFGEILATGARVLAEVIRLLRQLIGLLRDAIELAKELGDELGGLSFPGGGGGGFDLPGIPFLAEGGVIEGPVGLSGGGTEGKAFQSGGILGSLTRIFGASNVTPTSQLGVAGEAGPEAILPLARTSGGLGVTSVLPPEVTALLRANIANLNRSQAGGVTVVNRIAVISAPSQRVEDLEEEVLALDASVEQRNTVSILDILSEAS